jgi:ketosteroid isomerase-like protein
MDLKRKQEWLDTWDGPINLEARDFKITVRGDIAFANGFFRMSGRPKAAGRAISFWMRATVCLRRDNGAEHMAHRS